MRNSCNFVGITDVNGLTRCSFLEWEHNCSFRVSKERCVVSRIVRSQEPKEKRRKRERELENPHGAIRLKAVAGALEHRRRRDNSSRQTNKAPKEKPGKR